MDKDLFLKPLDKLFGLENLIFSIENTIIVNDSPLKHVMNFSRSVLLVETWLYQRNGAIDKTLIDDLLLWIQCLHLSKPESLFTLRVTIELKGFTIAKSQLKKSTKS